MTTDTPDFFAVAVKEEAPEWEALERWPRPLAGVRIDGEYLYLAYRKPYYEGRGPLELAAANAEMLSEFANLWEGDCSADGRLVRFATRYGGLGLCKEHGWPFAHKKPHCPTDRSETPEGLSYRERIKDWRNFSAYARAIMATLVTRSGPARDSALAVLNKGGDADENRAIIRWLAGSEIKLWFPPRPSGLTFFGVPPLWTGIALQLAMLAAGARRIILCSSCGRLVPVKRLHRSDERRSYCRKCTNNRKRDAVADLRQRQRLTAELHAEGKTAAEIAEALGLKPAQVKRYLTKRK